MTRALLIIRPEPGNGETVARARALGMEAKSCPLFEVVALDWNPPASNAYDALLLTSANAVQQAGPALDAFMELPAFCVGAATAQAASKAGLYVAAEGIGSASDLLASLPDLNFLHLCGTETASIRLAHSSIQHLPIYSSLALAPSPEFADILSLRPVIAVHSPRAGSRLNELVKDRSAISIAAISQNTAQAAGFGWEAVAIADKPRDDALLAAAAKLIQELENQST